MEDHDELPEPLKKVRHSLQPFIKKRQDVVQIRKILSSHLSVHLNVDRGLRPLSLVDPTSSIDAAPHGVRGIQKEYLRFVRANIKAKNEYSEASKDHHVGQEGQASSVGMREQLTSQDGTGSSLRSFLDLVQQRQKQERLRIIQDYIEMLSQKPASSVGHLDPQEVLKGVEALPKVPPEVVSASSSSHTPNGKDLNVLVDQLEKSVLRAKMLLTREQKLLAKYRAENANPSVRRGNRLQAVDATRHELINWIECELGRTGDSPLEAEESHGPADSAKQGKEYIDTELASIQRQYARYLEARQALVAASGGTLKSSPLAELDQDTGLQQTREGPQNASGMNQAIYPYLEAMVIVSNEQKAMIQQKSHLTISLSKQLKESSQGLDRLADESHLLPVYPIPAVGSQRKVLEGAVSFGEQMSSHEKPDTSLRARAWVFASESASYATKEAVSERLEEGAKSIAEAREMMSELEILLGGDGKADIWGTLDGNLGVIKEEVAAQS
ncbi:hypothetical protein N431DRAFT_425292 [Stipitochalara longipes BDJ]|nr:hypothetical protein N431DRAFT_425292 [Stipitochalara longipes BDJ]